MRACNNPRGVNSGDSTVAKKYYVSLKIQVKRMHYHNKTFVLIF